MYLQLAVHSSFFTVILYTVWKMALAIMIEMSISFPKNWPNKEQESVHLLAKTGFFLILAKLLN